MSAVVLPVVLPLLAAFLMQPLARVSTPIARLLGPVTLLVGLAILVRAWLGLGDESAQVAFGGFAAPVGIVFYIDKLALIFAIATALFTLLFWADEASGETRTRRDALMLLMASAATGLALSGDLFNIFVFYELAAVASYGLVTVKGTDRAFVAAVRYILISAFGSVMALIGIAIVYMLTGTLNLAQLAQLAPETLHGGAGLAAFTLMLIGFGVKAELFPLNTWVPEVYSTAPARLSGLLAGLISKLAVLVVVRILVLMFAGTEASTIMLVLGLLGILTGELAAWRAKDFTRMIAFSSIGQLGIVFIGFSLGSEVGILAGLAVALHHLIIKSGLFALAVRWGGSLQGLAGAGKSAPMGSALFVLFALSLIGVPPLPGFWTKVLVLAGLAQAGTALHLTALAAILFATALEANYLFRAATVIYGESDERGPSHGFWDFALAAILGITLLAATWYIDPIFDELRAVAAQAGDVPAYIETVLPGAAESAPAVSDPAALSAPAGKLTGIGGSS